MKSILCFGDSNTWGQDPAGPERLGRDVRWPGVLRIQLGGGWEVIEEGLPGRTTIFNDPIWPGRNGRAYLDPCLKSHSPLDVVIIMLGTNDLQTRFASSAEEIAQGAGTLVALAQEYAPRVLLICPPPYRPPAEVPDFLEGAEGKSRKLAKAFQQIAELYGCEFLDAGSVAQASEIDGTHLDPGAHESLGRAVAEAVSRETPPVPSG